VGGGTTVCAGGGSMGRIRKVGRQGEGKGDPLGRGLGENLVHTSDHARPIERDPSIWRPQQTTALRSRVIQRRRAQVSVFLTSLAPLTRRVDEARYVEVGSRQRLRRYQGYCRASGQDIGTPSLSD